MNKIFFHSSYTELLKGFKNIFNFKNLLLLVNELVWVENYCSMLTTLFANANM